MAQLNPYLRFNDGKCREAMTFYKDCLGGGELSFQLVSETPMAKDMSPEAQNKIMHSSLKKDGIEIYGSDMMRDRATVGDNFVMSLNCDSEEELKTLFDKLSQGGEIFMAPEKQFWGAIFGMLTDKYGVEWMFNYNVEK